MANAERMVRTRSGDGHGVLESGRARGAPRGARALRAALIVVLLAKLTAAGFSYRGALAVAVRRRERRARRDGERRRGSRRRARPRRDDGRQRRDRAGPAWRGRAKAPEVRTLLDAVTPARANSTSGARADTPRGEAAALRAGRDRKLSSLEELEKRLQARAKAASAAVAAAAESLAKVYGAMKPEDALRSRAARRTDRAHESRAHEGKTDRRDPPLMSRDKAIVLTRSLAERR